MRDIILKSLDADKAIDVTTLDLKGKTSIADYMIVASGTSQRHIASMADRLASRLKENDMDALGIEGLEDCSWVLIDANDVLVHLFRAETRSFYDIERLWSVAPGDRLRVVSSQ
ncbi:MAG: ribosome silencing factor [Geminicoccaceae bacterium]|nr:ribosome silencing factor [Geminicoccaceae bacterium]